MDASMLVAVTGAFTAATASFFTFRGIRDQNRQQTAADRAIEDKGRLDETQQIIDGQAQALRDSFTREQQLIVRNGQLEARNQQLEDELDEKDLLRRHQLSQQEARCREQTVLLTDALITLRAVVVDEVAQTAAATILDRTLPHPHDPPALGPAPAPGGPT